jgi:acetyl esterase/lipase
MRIASFLCCYFLLTTNVFSSLKGIYRDIPYVPVNSSDFNSQRHILDVYTPRNKDTLTEVVVFIHGGKWKSGSKDMFNYIGVNFAEKGIAAVLINYRLVPEVTYEEMAMDCAKAVKWAARAARQPPAR